MPQVSPSYPASQEQVKLSTPSVQLPCTHGSGEQSSILLLHSVPSYPESQIQIYPSTWSWQVPVEAHGSPAQSLVSVGKVHKKNNEGITGYTMVVQRVMPQTAGLINTFCNKQALHGDPALIFSFQGGWWWPNPNSNHARIWSGVRREGNRSVYKVLWKLTPFHQGYSAVHLCLHIELHHIRFDKKT